MMTSTLSIEEIKKVVRWMIEEIDCQILVPGPDGWYDISGQVHGFKAAPEMLVEIFKDGDAVYAEWYGVEKDLYIRWEENYDNDSLFQCKGHTKKGRRCLNGLGSICPHPKDFDEMSDWYCPVHEDQRVVERA